MLSKELRYWHAGQASLACCTIARHQHTKAVLASIMALPDSQYGSYGPLLCYALPNLLYARHMMRHYGDGGCQNWPSAALSAIHVSDENRPIKLLCTVIDSTVSYIKASALLAVIQVQIDVDRSAMQLHKGLQPCCALGQPFTRTAHSLRHRCVNALQMQQQQNRKPGRSTYCRIRCSAQHQNTERIAAATISSSFTLWLLSELPALAEQTDFSKGSFAKESYYVTLGLFLLSLPGTFFSPVLS